MLRPYRASRLIPPLAGLACCPAGDAAAPSVAPSAEGAVKKSALSPNEALFSNPLLATAAGAACAGAALAGSLKSSKSTPVSIWGWAWAPASDPLEC